ncbi:MAG: hypothetical protein H0U40_11010 [Chloroflexia bacterium]|nr:hypothetical protein [Chloroflexia bacterium]
MATRGFAIVAMLVAFSAPARPALADHATRDGMFEERYYISVQFNYQFEWDSPWEADLDRVEVVEGEYDRVVIVNGETGAEIEVVGAAGADPADVLDSVAEGRVSDSGAEVVAEDEGTVDDVDFVSATVAYEGEDGAIEEYIESRAATASGETAATDGAMTFFVRAPEGELDDTLAEVQSVFLRDMGFLGPMLLGVAGAATQSGGDDEDATATAEAGETAAADEDDGGRDEDDETATAEAEETEAAEAEETEAAEDEDPGGTADETGVDGDAYESPTFGYTLEWDEDLWTVNEERTEVGDRDVLTLDYADGGFLFIEGYEDYDGDPADCLVGSADEILGTDEVEDVEPLEDDGGDVIEGEDGGVAFAAYSLLLGEEDAIAYFDCRTLVEDEAVLAFSLIVAGAAGEDAIADLADLQDTLELADEGGSVSDDDATQTAEAEDGSSAGVETYESDAGWTVEFDTGVWSPVEPSDEQEFELRLNSTASTADFTVFEDFDGDAEACVEDRVARIGNGTFDEIDEVEGVTGDAGQASATYELAFEGDDGPVELTVYVECRTVVAGESVVEILFASEPDDFDAELEAFGDVLDAIETPDAGDGGPVLSGSGTRRQAA